MAFKLLKDIPMENKIIKLEGIAVPEGDIESIEVENSEFKIEIEGNYQSSTLTFGIREWKSEGDFTNKV